MNSNACSHMQSLDLPKEEIIKCFHCGNETPMAQKGEYCWGSRGIEYENFGFSYKYELFACPVCHKVTLRETYSDETMIFCNNPDQMQCCDEKSILYPVSSFKSIVTDKNKSKASEYARNSSLLWIYIIR